MVVDDIEHPTDDGLIIGKWQLLAIRIVHARKMPTVVIFNIIKRCKVVFNTIAVRMKNDLVQIKNKVPKPNGYHQAENQKCVDVKPVLL